MHELTRSVQLLAHRLSGEGALPSEDVGALAAIVGPERHFAKGEMLVDQGDRASNIWLMEDGWAFRQKMLDDGRRQITAIMLCGELSEKGPVMPFGTADAIVAATDVVAQPIDRHRLAGLLEQRPRLLRSFFYEELTRHAVSREWLLLLGKRQAIERLAYFLFETYARLNAMGMVAGAKFHMPLTQVDLADIVGMSAVHLNRSLQQLRAADLVIWEGAQVELTDPPALARLAVFNRDMIRIAEDFGRRALTANDDQPEPDVPASSRPA